MTVRAFVPWPDPRLRAVTPPVAEVTDAIREIWSDMIDTMDAMPGLGLAAPQIGVMQSLAVVDASQERGQAIRLANPRLIEASSATHDYPEGSPNLPGVSARLTRPSRVVVAFLNEAGDAVERGFEGLWATSVQHQIDHLNGRMYFDHLSRTKRSMLIKRARKLAESEL